MSNPVSLQVSFSPSDLRHAAETVPHQIHQWADQVAEIEFTVDRGASMPSSNGGGESVLVQFLRRICERLPHARVDIVDYTPQTVEQIAAHFVKGPMPLHDYRAGAIYPFLYGLGAATHDCVLHADSDMLFGGGSQCWVEDALELLARREDALIVSALPGPPTSDGRVPPEVARRHAAAHPVIGARGDGQPEREWCQSLAYRFTGMSWRTFLMDRERLRTSIGPFSIRRPPPRQTLVALIDRQAPWTTLERSLSHAMVDNGLCRIDLLGREPGMWSLHPPYRSETFYRELPGLIRRVEAGEMPAAQLGDFDVNDSLIDWSSAREQERRRRWWRRLRS
jgi:hypothetical protein